MKRLSWNYTSDPRTDYRNSVKHSGQDIYHSGEAALHDGVLGVVDESALSEHALAHTSLFHWITYLATHPPEHMAAAHSDFEPSPRKYKSDQRRSLLIGCAARHSPDVRDERAK